MGALMRFRFPLPSTAISASDRDETDPSVRVNTVGPLSPTLRQSFAHSAKGQTR